MARSHCCAICGDCIAMAPTTAITISGIGLPTAESPARRRQRTEQQSERNDVDMRRLGSTEVERSVRPRSCSFCDGRQLGNHIGDGESGRVGVGEDANGKGPQPRRVRPAAGLLRRGEDERPDAAPCFDDARALELGVDAGDRVGVDAQLDGELTDGRKLLAGLRCGPVAMAARSPRSSCA